MKCHYCEREAVTTVGEYVKRDVCALCEEARKVAGEYVDSISMEKESMAEKEPEVVMEYEHKIGSTWWFHHGSADILPKHCSWKLLSNGDLIIRTEIQWTKQPDSAGEKP